MVMTRALLVTAIMLIAPLTAPGTASAGTAEDYPEFPYQPTDYTEPYRGQFHFSPREGWMNDINAPLFYRGEYHLFFQHNPHGLTWDTMHWGHATSPDLVHWTQRPIALEPGVHPGDLWSGSGVVDTANTSGLRDGIDDPIVLFTGTNGVRIAYSTDGGTTFQSYDGGNPVVTPAGTSRDAKVFWHEPTQRWVMVVWSDDGGNGVDIYTAPDLLNWTFQSRFAASWLYECPDLFALPVDGDPTRQRWVLTDAEGEYVVGDFDGSTFTSGWTSPVKMDKGRTAFDNGTFYAGLTVNPMPDDRVVQLAWQPSNQGSVWSGNASFPAELGLRATPEGPRVTRRPIDEIASLRTKTSSWSNQTITTDPASDPLTGVTADTYEIEAEFDLTGATATGFGFELHARDDGSYDRAVTYDVGAQTLYGDPLLPENGRIRMRLLVDRGQLAVFGNDGVLSHSDNVDFDSSPGSQGIRLFASGGDVELVALDLHHLGSAWGTGESTLRTNLGEAWHPVGGTWTDTAGGKRGTDSADAFYLSERTGTDFTYQGDLRVVSGAAAGLTFRANADASQHYTVTLDTAGVVKLWRPGADIATVNRPIEPRRTYHVKVVTAGSRIQVFLDGESSPVIDATDSTYSSGRFGANVFNGTAEAQHLTVNTSGLCTDLAGPWQPISGSWEQPRGAALGAAAGDGFLLSAQHGTDFTYQGDLRVVSGAAAGLTFRANADASEHYTATLDTAGVVKLWRPGVDIATVNRPIERGRTYHVRVVTAGDRIQVFLDGESSPVIDATDGTYSSGQFGANVFAGSSEARNLTVSGPFCTSLDTAWHDVGGSWTEVAGGKQGAASGDAFSLSEREGANLTYEGHLRVVSGAAAGLTFRANADASQHYTVTLDTAGVVKLWRPGVDIATASRPIEAGRAYHVRVIARGPSISVYLNHDDQPVIDATDDTYTSGRFGVNVFDGTAQFQGVHSFAG